jgi:hypothetical protein
MQTTTLSTEIAERLEALMLYQTQFLIIERVASPYYVQFLPTEQGELYCEAVGNHYLEGADRLDDEAELDLIGLGWSSPTPNFSQLWDEQLPFAEIGDRMARTLIEIFGVQHDEDVTYTYGRRAS